MTVTTYGAGGEGTNAWTDPSNARGTSADTTYATVAPNKNSTVNGIWNTYGISIASGAIINSVKVTPRYKCSVYTSVAILYMEVSWDGGSSWSSVYSDSTEPTSDTDWETDVSGVTTWDTTKLGNIAVRIGGRRGNSNTAVTISLDRVTVTVDYTVVNTYTTTKNSDARFKKLGLSVTKPSDAVFEEPTVYPATITATSDARFKRAYSSTKNADAAFDIPFSGGSGTVGDPWQITTLIQLQHVGMHLSGNFILMNDIDASSTSTWNGGEGFVPIGNSTTPFTGTFDGDGKTISGLYINRHDAADLYQALFGYLDGSVTELAVTDAYVYGYSRTAILVGWVNTGATLSYCKCTGVVRCLYQCVAPIAAWVRGTVTNCYAITTSVLADGEYASGIVDKVDTGGVLRNCYGVSAYVSADTYWSMGTNLNDGTIENCFFDSTYSTHTSYGTAKTAAEMKQIATFVGWSIANG